ncbi:MAG: hypothetical protein OXG35_01435 [Acidobacteria bacterium]|nr:hypothetical protein [Acidobacteriota bacterium]
MIDCMTLKDLIIGELSVPLALTGATYVITMAAVARAGSSYDAIDSAQAGRNFESTRTPAEDTLRQLNRTMVIAGAIAIAGLATLGVEVLAIAQIADAATACGHENQGH